MRSFPGGEPFLRKAFFEAARDLAHAEPHKMRELVAFVLESLPPARGTKALPAAGSDRVAAQL